MLRKTITLAIALVILLVVAFANAAPVRLANDAKVMPVNGMCVVGQKP